MRKLFKYILKRAYYASLINNPILTTSNERFDAVKKSLSRGLSFGMFFMPIIGISMMIAKVLKLYDVVPFIFQLIIALISIPLILNPVTRILNSISLTELEENNSEIQKKLSNEYSWFVLIFLVSVVFFMGMIRFTYLYFR